MTVDNNAGWNNVTKLHIHYFIHYLKGLVKNLMLNPVSSSIRTYTVSGILISNQCIFFYSAATLKYILGMIILFKKMK